MEKVKPALSAGRVQSVAVRLIVEREREISAFKPEAAYRVIGEFLLPGGELLKAELSQRLKTEDEAKALLEACKTARFSIGDVTVKPAKKSPAAPFTTSTLQQEAARKLGFSVAQTMMVAQRLYEAGHITYMRTDSVNLSSLAINTTKDEIVKLWARDICIFEITIRIPKEHRKRTRQYVPRTSAITKSMLPLRKNDCMN